MTREEMLGKPLYRQALRRLPADLHPTFWLMCGLYGEACERLIFDEKWRCWYEGIADVLLGLRKAQVDAARQGKTMNEIIQADYDASVRASKNPASRIEAIKALDLTL